MTFFHCSSSSGGRARRSTIRPSIITDPKRTPLSVTPNTSNDSTYLEEPDGSQSSFSQTCLTLRRVDSTAYMTKSFLLTPRTMRVCTYLTYKMRCKEPAAASVALYHQAALHLILYSACLLNCSPSAVHMGAARTNLCISNFYAYVNGAIRTTYQAYTKVSNSAIARLRARPRRPTSATPSTQSL